MNTTNWNASQGWAAGAIAMTAEQLAAYGKALAAGELFESADSLAQMLAFEGGAGALYNLGAPYGLGLIDFGNDYWGHAGETLGFQTLWYTNPEEQITVVGLTNSASYEAYGLLNVLNILKGEGARPFGPLTLMPIGESVFLGDIVGSNWGWVQLAGPSGATDIAPGTTLVLFKDGSAKVKSEACGEAPGTFAVDASWQITFDLDVSGITCAGEEPTAQLLDLLDSADMWQFENGRLLITLNGGSSLLSDLLKPE